MGKQSKRLGRRDRKRYNSPLSAHKQQGRILKPPFKALPNMREIPWPKQMLPDMLWLCSVLAANDEMVAIPAIARTLDVIDGAIASNCGDRDKDKLPVMDGRLTALERVPEKARDRVVSDLEDRGLYELAVPERFGHSLGMYPTAPGRWLLRPRLDRGLAVDWEVARGFLSQILVESLDGRGRIATRAKAIVVGRHLKAGKITVSRDANLPFDLLSKYPFGLNEDELKEGDAISRAMFMGLVGISAEEDDPNPSERWARTFWRSN